MSLGTAILRPQGLSRAPAHGGTRAFELAVEFLESLMADPEGLQATLEALAASGGEVLPAFLHARKEKMRKAEGRFRAILRPLNSLILEFLGGIGEGIPESLPAALKALRGMLGLLGKESAIPMLRDLIDTARTGLGIDREAVEKLFRDCIGGAALRLEAAVAAGDLSDAALRRFEWGLNLRDFGRLVLEELDWPALDADALARSLESLYVRKGWDKTLARFGKLLDAAASLSEPLSAVISAAMEPKVRVGGSVGAAAADGAPAAPAAPARVPVCWYATWILRKEVRFEVKASTTEIPAIAAVTYNCLTPRDMENLAYHSLWISDLGEHILHMISIEQKDIAVNALNGSWSLFNCVSNWVNRFSLPGWLQWTVTTPNTILGGLETARCSGSDDAVYPLIEILGDAAETVLYKRWAWLAREFVLSVATLANHDPDKAEAARKKAAEPYADLLKERDEIGKLLGTEKDPAKKAALEERMAGVYGKLSEYRWLERQGNHNQFHGWVYGFGEVGAMVLPLILADTDRTNYGMGKDGPTGPMIGKMFGGMGIAMAFRAVGLLLGSAIARRLPDDTEGAVFTVVILANERFLWNPRNDDKGVFAGRFFWLLANFIVEFMLQSVYLYLFTNAETDDGTLGFLPSRPGLEVSFPGFGDPATSPYKLPWAEGVVHQCVQNPMGIWNHFPGNGFAYAIDFNHDAGDDVLACRQGIITNLATGNANNASPKNSIEILALNTFKEKPRYAMDPVPPPAGIAAYTDAAATAIDADSRFPPYWDVNGNPWPGLPGTLPLHPLGAFHSAASGIKSDIPDGFTTVSFLDPDHDRGLKGLVFAAFSDGTPVPAGVVFAPDAPNPPTPITPMYRGGTTFSPIPSSFASSPYPTAATGSPAVAPPAGMTFYDGEPIPAGVALPPDCVPGPLPADFPAHLPMPHPATPLYLPGTMMTTYTASPTSGSTTSGAAASGGSEWFNAGTRWCPVGIPALPIPVTGPANLTFFTPVVFAFMEYQHGITNFTRISASPASTPGQPEKAMTDCFETGVGADIRGRFVEQGRVVMLSGDTGTSLFNHLHVQAHVDSAQIGRPNFTIPFVFADVEHSFEDHGLREMGRDPGIPMAMNWYDSGNKRTTYLDAESLK